MPRMKRADEAGGIDHLLNRGNAPRELFHKPDDYQTFLRTLHQGLEKYPVDLLAFCLLPNHWHLVVRPQRELTPIPFLGPRNRLVAACESAVSCVGDRAATMRKPESKRDHQDSVRSTSMSHVLGHGYFDISCSSPCSNALASTVALAITSEIAMGAPPARLLAEAACMNA